MLSVQNTYTVYVPSPPRLLMLAVSPGADPTATDAVEDPDGTDTRHVHHDTDPCPTDTDADACVPPLSGDTWLGTDTDDSSGRRCVVTFTYQSANTHSLHDDDTSSYVTFDCNTTSNSPPPNSLSSEVKLCSTPDAHTARDSSAPPPRSRSTQLAASLTTKPAGRPAISMVARTATLVAALEGTSRSGSPVGTRGGSTIA
mmetsp:Transcript_28259/g.91397  ORF Transcript_28259/g.91397 Transcript_28259/m.91397 type:complete len:200 (-) Transcript_28259:38-637(-)